MIFKKFEDCEVWQMGRELVREVYSLTRGGEFAKDFGLKDQIQRAAVSISSNVAEGYARRGNKEFVKFLWIAKGSAAEVQSQLYHAKDLDYIDTTAFERVYNSTKSNSSQTLPSYPISHLDNRSPKSLTPSTLSTLSCTT